MKRVAAATALTLIYAAAAAFSSAHTSAAQTHNDSARFTVNENFTFPNPCTGELMDISDTTNVVCHRQQRADGTSAERCHVVQDVTAVGQTTGITFHGTGTFKDEFAATDACDFTYANRGRVNLVSPGSDVNLVLGFDELVSTEACVLTADSHLVSADCRGAGR